MKRFVMEDLIKWKNTPKRKPLILKGARQVGKTYILKQFGSNNYENVAYFNFDHDEDLYNIFEHTKDPIRIIEQLSFIHGKAIKKDKTLIIFDEIQECPNALNCLKYFFEEAPEYHIACAGSLLGIRLSHTSFPVGKVEFLEMYPMTFLEFLMADGCENLVSYLDSINKIETIPEPFFIRLEEKLKAYFIIGGMPEVVLSWVTDKDMEQVDKIQSNILKTYENDFAKHTSNYEANKISLIWNNIPSQLAKDNKKFLYQVVKNGARAREYENALNWLKDANIINKINDITKPSLPLCAYTNLNAFKIYLFDVGLLRKMTNLDSKIVIQGNKLYEEFKGSFTENYCIQQLSYLFDVNINYFTFDKYEIDFIIQTKNEIIPIEVKSGNAVSSPSLKKYIDKYSPQISIRFSMKNLSFDNNTLNIPLFMIEYLPRLIDIIFNNKDNTNQN